LYVFQVVLFSVKETIQTAVEQGNDGEGGEDEGVEDVADDCRTKTAQSHSTRQVDNIVLNEDDGVKSFLPDEVVKGGLECRTVANFTRQPAVPLKHPPSASRGSGANQRTSSNGINSTNSTLNLKRERSEVVAESSNVKSEGLMTADPEDGTGYISNNNVNRRVKLETAWAAEVGDDDGCIYVQSDEEYDGAADGEEYAEGEENYEGTEDWGVKEESSYGYEDYGEGDEEGAGYDPGPSTSYDPIPGIPGQVRRRASSNKMMTGSGRKSGPRPVKRQRLQHLQPGDQTDMTQV